MTQRFLAFDVGTSGVKAVVTDADGLLVGSAYRRYGLELREKGRAEQDIEEILDAMLAAGAELVSSGTPIAGISVTAQMFNVVAVDASGTPVYPMISWLDQRSEPDAEALIRRIPPDEQFKRFSAVLTGKDIVPKILWLQREKPEVVARAAWLLDCKEAIVLRLTGRAVIDRTGASAYRLFGVGSDRWDAEACQAAGVPMALLPEIARATDVAGPLVPEIADRLGLPAGVPVYVGAGDVPASQLGSGAVRVGDVHVSMGTAVYFGVTTDRPVHDPSERIGALAHADPGKWIMWLEIATGGAALAWITRLLGLDDAPFEQIETLVRDSEDEMDGLLFAPWLSGERVPVFDDSMRASFVGLALHHGPGHVIRAVMEGVGFQMRWALDYGESFCPPLGTLRAVGGGSIGAVWTQIITDILGRPLETIEAPQDAGAVGAAACAITGCGAKPDFSFLAGRAGVRTRYLPDPARAGQYSRRYEQFRRLYEALYPHFHPGTVS